jgi:transcriptional regulator with XRE-family HTH domain
LTREANEQVPLGELITKARLDAGLSRVELSKRTGISENSLMRYEKAGLEADGQYPPAPKLARICFELGISPLKALLGCLEEDEYWKALNITTEDYLQDHPNFEYLTEQAIALMKDNFHLRNAIRVLIGDNWACDVFGDKEKQYIVEQARRLIHASDDFENNLRDQGFDPVHLYEGFVFPGRPGAKGKQDSPVDWANHNYAQQVSNKKNGPDDSPSRSVNQELLEGGGTPSANREDDHDGS